MTSCAVKVSLLAIGTNTHQHPVAAAVANFFDGRSCDYRSYDYRLQYIIQAGFVSADWLSEYRKIPVLFTSFAYNEKTTPCSATTDALRSMHKIASTVRIACELPEPVSDQPAILLYSSSIQSRFSC